MSYAQKALSAVDEYARLGLRTDVETASPHRLILLLLDGALEKLRAARLAMQRGNIAAKGSNIGWAMSIIDGLQLAILDAGGRNAASAQVEIGPEPLIVVDNVLQAAGRSFRGRDGTLLKLQDARREENGRIKLRLELQMPSPLTLGGLAFRNLQRVAPPGGRMAVRSELPALPLALLDAAERPIPLVAVESSAMNALGLAQDLSLTFAPRTGQAEPARLVYSGARSVVLDIPFTLKNVPLK